MLKDVLQVAFEIFLVLEFLIQVDEDLLEPEVGELGELVRADAIAFLRPEDILPLGRKHIDPELGQAPGYDRARGDRH